MVCFDTKQGRVKMFKNIVRISGYLMFAWSAQGMAPTKIITHIDASKGPIHIDFRDCSPQDQALKNRAELIFARHRSFYYRALNTRDTREKVKLLDHAIRALLEIELVIQQSPTLHVNIDTHLVGLYLRKYKAVTCLAQKVACLGQASTRSMEAISRSQDDEHLGENYLLLSSIYAHKSEVTADAQEKCTFVEQGHEYLRKSAEKGHVDAQFIMAADYIQKKEDADNLEEQVKCLKHAIEWYEKAARQGHRNAQNCLGGLLCEKANLLSDPQERERIIIDALYWFALAARGGHLEAQANVRILTRKYNLYVEQSGSILTVKKRQNNGKRQNT